jgi:L-iditol 2-dehydrogenase
MKAAVLHASDDLRIEDIAIPQPGKGEVLVKVRACGICGSDIPRVLGDGAHYYPIVLGHEFSGDIARTGEGVTRVKAGDRVAGAPLIPCMKCVDCQKGYYSQCKFYTFIGSKIQGCFAEYVKLPEINVVKIEYSVSYEQAALFEPATVAAHGLECIKYGGGEDVAVLGCGTIGLFAAQWAKIFGAKRVFAFDIDQDRLALAGEYGADVLVDTRDAGFRARIDDLTGGQGFPYVLEAAGVEPTMQLAFEVAANKASVLFIGTPVKDLTFSRRLFENLNRKEFTLTGSWMSYSAPFPGREWHLAAHYTAIGQLKIDDRLIFKKLPLNKISEGFEMFKVPGLVKGKIMIVNDQEAADG